MKQISKFVLMLVLAMTAAVALPSCDSDHPYFDPPYYYDSLEGNWTLVSINGYPVSDREICEFTFYANGTGVYGQYQGNLWVTSYISWEQEMYSGGRSTLWVYPGGGQVWEYDVRDYGSQIELRDVATRDRLLFQAY